MVVLTGRNRVRGTSSASDPSNTSIAAPIADSSWTTSGDVGSAGSTVLRLMMMGRPRKPARSAIRSRRTDRSTQMLLALNVSWRLVSAKNRSSPSATIAVSRRMRRPSDLRVARCPPLRSLFVRVHTSATKGSPCSTIHAATSGSQVAPRLSELEMNA